MATLTIRNVPDALHGQLKAQAAENNRSLNKEVIHRLQSAGEREETVESELERVRAIRQKLEGVYVTDDWIEKIIDRRRP